MAFPGSCGPCGTPNPPNRFGGPASSPWATRGRGDGAGGAGGAGNGGEGPVTPPEPQGPPAVLLGGADFFKILTKTGITNVPTSSIIGNMGVSPITSAAITGFALVLDGSGEFSTSAQVVGRVYAADYAPPTPALLTAAVLDMEAAYTDAAGRPADFTDVNAGLIGGLTLIPGVYKFTTGVTIATNMQFQGGPDDTWIIQIDGTLAVAAGVEIFLSGGAQAKNIVWQVAGATTIGPGADFKVLILDQTSIAVQTGASVIGKLYAQTAVTLDQNFVNG